MPNLAYVLAAAGALLLPFLASASQDPPPTPPAATPLPSATAQTPNQDPPGRPARHPFEGVYELRRRVMAGKPDHNPSRGYLAITQRHLFLQVAAPGPDPDVPLVRASVRTWKAQPEHVATTIQLGWFTDVDGEVHAEKPGSEEKRRIELVQGGVRVVQDERNWLEFERVE